MVTNKAIFGRRVDALYRALRRPSVAFLLLAFLVMVITYGGPYVIYFVDEQFPFNTTRVAQQLFEAWLPRDLGVSSGINIFSLPTLLPYVGLASLGLPPWIVQFLVNVFALWLSGYSMFVFLGYFLSEHQHRFSIPAAVVGSLSYMLSIVATEVLYWDFIPAGPFLQAFLPLQLLVLLKGFDELKDHKSPKLTYILGFALISLFTLAANIPIAVNTAVLVSAFTLWRLANRLPSAWLSALGKRLEYVGALLAGTIAANAFWILPELSLLSTPHASPASPVNFASISRDFNGYTSRLSFLSGLQLTGLQRNLFTWYSGYMNWSPLGSLLLLPATMALFLPIVKLRRFQLRTQRSSILFAALLLIVLCMVYSGVNMPFYDGLLKYVFVNPYVLIMVRNTGNSFGLAISFLQSCLWAFGALSMVRWIRRPNRPAFLTPNGTRSRLLRGRHLLSRLRPPTRWASIATVAVFVLLALPYNIPAYTGWLVPRAPYSARVEVPGFVQEVADYINSHAGNNYTLLVPGGFQEQYWPAYGGHGYIGYDILTNLIQTPVIMSAGGGLGGEPNQLIQKAYSYLSMPPEPVGYARLLTLLRVKYVVVERDVEGQYPWAIRINNNVTTIENFLAAQNNISKLISFGDDDIFENMEVLPPAVSIPEEFTTQSLAYTNITQLFYNSSSLIGNGITKSPLMFSEGEDGSLSLQVSAQAQMQGLRFPGYPIVFNGVPLNISIAQFPYLAVTFRTGSNTALMFQITNSGQLPTSGFNDDWISTWQFSTPSSNGQPNAGWYYSPNNYTTVVIDMIDAYANLGSAQFLPQEGVLNYFSISFWPTLGNATENLVPGSPPVNFSLNLKSVALGTPFYSTRPNPISPPITPASFQNLTRNYAELVNARTASSLTSPLNVTSDGSGFEFSYRSASNQSLSYPGFPVIFNSVPMSLPLETYACMVITFRTRPGTSLGFGISSSASISVSNWAKVWQGVEGNAYPTSTTGLYSTNGTFATLAIDLETTLWGAQSGASTRAQKALNFMYMILVGSSDTVGATVASILVANTCKVARGEISVVEDPLRVLSVGTPANPTFRLGYDVLVPEVTAPTRLAKGVNLASTRYSQTRWSIALTNTTGETIVVFSQNFDENWRASVSSGSANLIHTIADDYANAWIVSPLGSSTTIVISLSFLAQNPLDTGILVSSIGLLSIIILFVVQERSRAVTIVRSFFMLRRRRQS